MTADREKVGRQALTTQFSSIVNDLRLGKVVDGCYQLSLFIEGSKEALAVIAEKNPKIQMALKNVIAAQDNSDWILFTDRLDYELFPEILKALDG